MMNPDGKPKTFTRPSILKYFKYDHLPSHLQQFSKPFCELAEKMCSDLPDNAERAVALRKLLEAKDAAVRSTVE